MIEYLSDAQLDAVVGGLAVDIFMGPASDGHLLATTGNANGLINGVSGALAIVGRNPTPLDFQVVA